MSRTIGRLKLLRNLGTVLPGVVGLVCLCGNLAGCGSSTGIPTPPPFVISGRVLAPPGTVINLGTRARDSRAIDLSTNVPVGAGIVVQLGTVDGNGDLPPAVIATTTTTATGAYAFTFPNPITIQPNMVVVVPQVNGPVTAPLLYSVLTGPITDISPASTAATQSLYAAATAAHVQIGQFQLLDLQTYFNEAMLAGAGASGQSSVSTAVTAAATAIAASAAATNAQTTAITDATAPAGSGSGSPGQAQSMADLYAHSTAGTGLGLLNTLLNIPFINNIPYPFSVDGLTFVGSLAHSTNGTGNTATVNVTGQYLVRGQFNTGTISADSGVLVNILVTLNITGSVGTGSIVGAIEYPDRPIESVSQTLAYSISGASQIIHVVQTVSQAGVTMATRDETTTFDTGTGITVDSFTETVHDPAASTSFVTAHGSFQTTPAPAGGTSPATNTDTVSLANGSSVTVSLTSDTTGALAGPAVLSGQTIGTVSIANGVVTVTPAGAASR